MSRLSRRKTSKKVAQSFLHQGWNFVFNRGPSHAKLRRDIPSNQAVLKGEIKKNKHIAFISKEYSEIMVRIANLSGSGRADFKGAVEQEPELAERAGRLSITIELVLKGQVNLAANKVLSTRATQILQGINKEMILIYSKAPLKIQSGKKPRRLRA